MAPLLHLVMFLLYLAQSNPILASPKSLVLPLKAQTHPHGFSLLPKLSRHKKVGFSHNVTLTVTVTVGSPPQAVTMVLDTGSELSWLRCKKSPLFNNTFNHNRSRSYTPIPCSSPTCTIRTRDLINPVQCDSEKLCHVILSYADASSVEGSLAADTLRIGDASMPRTVFGCMDSGSSTNVGEDSKTTGLLGLNRGSLSFVNQMGFPKFSYCISGFDSSGVLVFGEANFSWLKPLNYTPLVQMSSPLPYFNRVAYTLHLEGIRVSGTPLRISKDLLEPDRTGAGQTMVDSGTQFTFLLGPVYSALKAEFSRQVGGKLKALGDPGFAFQGAMDLCYLFQGRVLPDLPTVTLVFRGADMSVSGERLLYRVPGMVRGSDSVYCFTFGNSDLLGMEAYVVGNHHQENVWMEFDLQRSMVGIAQVRCDLASQRLGMSI